jgi:microcystin-dependent protein
MSTLKVNEVRHLSNSGTENIKLESNGTTNLQATNTLGLTVVGTLTVSGVSTFNGNVTIGNATTDTVDLQSKVTGFNNFSGFTGEIRMYAGNEGPAAPPTGWLYCNGDTISQLTGHGGTHYNADTKGNDYENLFNLLKTNSNWGNSGSPSWGTNTVKLPDFRSRSPVGVHTGAANALPTGLTARTIGIGTSIADGSTLVGKETHALSIAELAVHTHLSTIGASATGQSVSQASHTHTSAGHTHTSAGHTHSTPGSTTGSDGIHTHQVMQGYNAGSEENHALGSAWGGEGRFWSGQHVASSTSHTHSVPSGTSGSTTPSATGSTTPGVTGGTSGDAITLVDPQHSHASTAANTGSGTAHTILSPIIAVNYIIKV